MKTLSKIMKKSKYIIIQTNKQNIITLKKMMMIGVQIVKAPQTRFLKKVIQFRIMMIQKSAIIKITKRMIKKRTIIKMKKMC